MLMGSLLNSGTKHISIKCIFLLYFVYSEFYLLVSNGEGFLKTSSNIAQPQFSTTNFYLIGWLLIYVGFSQAFGGMRGRKRDICFFTNLCQILINAGMTEEKRKQINIFRKVEYNS